MNRIVLLVVLVLGLAGVASSTRAAQPVGDRATQPVYSYADAVRDTAWVSTGHDVDGDGKVDRVAADIIRPRTGGKRVPVIMDSSPYYLCCGRGNELQKKTYEKDGTPLGFPLFYDNYFVPRGYAVVLTDQAGSNRSEGCDGGPDARGTSVSVINWLNGRGVAYTSKTSNTRMRAGWANGSVGMIGKSDDGLIALETGVTGVRGLKTVVSIAGVVRPYDIFNPGGAWLGYPGGAGGGDPVQYKLCKAVDAVAVRKAGTSGDFNPFWRETDSLNKIGNMHASVLATQGFGDINVWPWQFSQLWSALGEQHIPRKAWLHQAGHIDPFDLRRADWVNTLHRWFDRWLMGIHNGIMDEPQVKLETSPDRWTDIPQWPVAGSAPHNLWPGKGTLGERRQSGTVSFVDDPTRDEDAWTAAPGSAKPYRQVFETAPLKSPVRMSGSLSTTLTVRSNAPVARVGAMVVDYGPQTVRNDLGQGLGIRTLKTRNCWGESRPGDSSCYLRTATDTTHVDQVIVSKGWADIGHYRTLRHRETLRPDRFYSMTFKMFPLDRAIPAGHRLALVIGGTDASQFVIKNPGRAGLTIDLARTHLSVPVVR